MPFGLRILVNSLTYKVVNCISSKCSAFFGFTLLLLFETFAIGHKIRLAGSSRELIIEPPFFHMYVNNMPSVFVLCILFSNDTLFFIILIDILCRVLKSRVQDYPEGSIVMFQGGWKTVCKVNKNEIWYRVDTLVSKEKITHAVGAVGMPG